MTAAPNEVVEIVARYERRKADGRDQCAQLLIPNRYLSHQEKERAFLRALRQRWAPEDVSQVRVLEVGCGYGDNLLQFIRWGCTPDNLVGNELLEQRCTEARRRLPQGVRILQGDAAALDLPPESFDIVLQSTVFTSILDDDFQTQLAQRMWSLTAPGGLVIWYDFAFNNPNNPDVRGVPRQRIRKLFPGGKNEIVRCEGASISVTVNGTPTNSGDACTTQSGTICFQSEGAEIHFKQISLRPLR